MSSKNHNKPAELKDYFKVMKATKLYITVYTDESIKRSLDGDNAKHTRKMEQYYSGSFTGRIDDTLQRIYGEDYTEQEDIPELTLAYGTIDEEYYAQLNDQPDTSENRLAYIENLSDEDLNRLLKKNKKNIDISLYGIQVTALFQNGLPDTKTFFRLTREQRNTIINCLKKTLPDALIYVYDYVLKPDIFFNDSDDIFEDGLMSIKNDTDITRERFHTQTYKSRDLNMVSLYVPVLIGKYMDSAVIDASAMFTGSIYDDDAFNPDCIDFSRIRSHDSIACKQTFKDGGIDKALSEALAPADETIVLSYINDVDDIPKIEAQMYRDICRTGKVNII